jgi:hypothetical protein
MGFVSESSAERQTVPAGDTEEVASEAAQPGGADEQDSETGQVSEVTEKQSAASPAPDSSADAESGSAGASGADGTSAGSGQQRELPDTLTFRITRTTWVAVASVVVCATPVATSHVFLLWVYLLPIALGVWITRMRTTVGADGVTVRHMAGTTSFSWDDVRSVKLNARGWSEAVLTSGKHVKMPAVRVRDLSLVSEMSRGRLPDPAR